MKTLILTALAAFATGIAPLQAQVPNSIDLVFGNTQGSDLTQLEAGLTYQCIKDHIQCKRTMPVESVYNTVAHAAEIAQCCDLLEACWHLTWEVSIDTEDGGLLDDGTANGTNPQGMTTRNNIGLLGYGARECPTRLSLNGEAPGRGIGTGTTTDQETTRAAKVDALKRHHEAMQ